MRVLLDELIIISFLIGKSWAFWTALVLMTGFLRIEFEVPILLALLIGWMAGVMGWMIQDITKRDR